MVGSRRAVGISLLALLACRHLEAGKTPGDTYREAKAAMEKAWQAEKRFREGVIRALEKTLANLRAGYQKTNPKFVKIRQNMMNNIRKTEARLARNRSELAHRTKEVKERIKEKARALADLHRELLRRGQNALQELEAALERTKREIAQKVEQARTAVSDALAEIERRAAQARASLEKELQEFRNVIDQKIADLQEKNRRVSTVYKVAYDLSRIETNLGGSRRVLTLDQLRRTRIGGESDAPLVPPELIEQIRSLPQKVVINAKGVAFSVSDPNQPGKVKLKRLIDYKKGKFPAGGSGGGVVTRPGALMHTVTIDGDVRVWQVPRFNGLVVSALTLWGSAGAGGVYISIPFQATAME